MVKTEIQITFTDELALQNFVKWLNKGGFELFMQSKFNKLRPNHTDSFVSCVATDEKTDWGHYFEIE